MQTIFHIFKDSAKVCKIQARMLNFKVNKLNCVCVVHRDRVYGGDGGDMSPPTIEQGGHNIFCPPNIL